MMNRATLLTLAALLTSSPFLRAKSELEVLRDRCAEQERQIRELEEENSKLRSLTGMAAKYASRPVSAVASAAPAAVSESKVAAESKFYTVLRGDSWERIARRFGIQSTSLAAMNGVKDSSILREGQRIKVPGAGTAAPGSVAAAKPATAAKPGPPAAGSYQIKQGDTYYSIGRKLGISADALVAANPTIKATALRPGLVIQLAKPATAVAAVAAHPVPVAPAAAVPQAAQGSRPAVAQSSQPAARTDPASPAASLGTSARMVPVAAATSTASIKPITIRDSTTYGEFANRHGTTVDRLNNLNSLDLVESTLLAKGSELYVPAQP